MAVAWNFSAGVDGFITKDELLGIAMQIIMPYIFYIKETI